MIHPLATSSLSMVVVVVVLLLQCRLVMRIPSVRLFHTYHERRMCIAYRKSGMLSRWVDAGRTAMPLVSYTYMYTTLTDANLGFTLVTGITGFPLS